MAHRQTSDRRTETRRERKGDQGQRVRAYERDVGTSGSVPTIPHSPGCRLAWSCPLEQMAGVGKQSGVAGRYVTVRIMTPQRS